MTKKILSHHLFSLRALNQPSFSSKYTCFRKTIQLLHTGNNIPQPIIPRCKIVSLTAMLVAVDHRRRTNARERGASWKMHHARSFPVHSVRCKIDCRRSREIHPKKKKKEKKTADRKIRRVAGRLATLSAGVLDKERRNDERERGNERGGRVAEKERRNAENSGNRQRVKRKKNRGSVSCIDENEKRLEMS